MIQVMAIKINNFQSIRSKFQEQGRKATRQEPCKEEDKIRLWLCIHYWFSVLCTETEEFKGFAKLQN